MYFSVTDKREQRKGRTFKEMEDLAVKMFNDDEIVQNHLGNNFFTKEKWTGMVNSKALNSVTYFHISVYAIWMLL